MVSVNRNTSHIEDPPLGWGKRPVVVCQIIYWHQYTPCTNLLFMFGKIILWCICPSMDEINVECLTQYHVNVSVLNKVADWLAASVCVCCQLTTDEVFISEACTRY